VSEYPVEALREAVVNALMHRDYAQVARGTQVQVEMYPDRLLVRNPGGLFGPVSEGELGLEGVSSSRNPVLAALLAMVRRHLAQLVEQGRLTATAPRSSRNRTYRLPRPAG
jgi:ATP-dependent DNA helicase RecG